MKLQYASDLHIEFKQNNDYLHANPLVKMADVLILAGDIYLFFKNKGSNKYFEYLSKTFEKIYWLPGNHEYYQSDVIRYHKFGENSISPNIEVVHNKTITIDGINLLFSTLWGNIEPKNELFIKSHVSDFSCINYDGEDFRPNHFNLLHKQSKSYLESELLRLQGQKNVVITHHVPSLYDYPEHYRKSSINQAFVVEMDDLIMKYQPEAWIYGHSQANTPEFTIGKTRMLTNQLGYVQMDEHKTFRLVAALEI